MDLISKLKARFKNELPGYSAQKLMLSTPRPTGLSIPTGARRSAVLLLLYPHGNDYKTILIERTKNGTTHSGQIAFPGGKQESMDVSLSGTALREAHEEVNVQTSNIEIFGELTSIYIPVSNYVVHPFVAFAPKINDLVAQETEVAQIIQPDLKTVFLRKDKVSIHYSNSLKIISPAYILDHNIQIWGATAMILSEFEVILKEVDYL